jgi:hypothetical protein
MNPPERPRAPISGSKERVPTAVVNAGSAANIAIVSPGYPDTPGGVTDHTARLVRHWSQAGHNVAVLGATAANPEEIVATWRDGGVAAILIQYVPFLYARRGLSHFPLRIVLAAGAARLRTAVFVHEPWVPRTRLPWLVLSPLQERQLRRLLTACDVAVTPVPAWRTLLGGNVSVVYVGSTLGDPQPSAAGGAEIAAPVVFSPLAAGLNWDWIIAAAQAVGAKPALTVIGADWETARRDPVLRRWADPTWDWRGRLDPAAVLALLARSRIVLAPFTDGLTGRRTSAFAAASTGARLISSRGPLFDPAFDAAPFALANTKSEFCELAQSLFAARERPGARRERIEWYQRRLSPADLDRSLARLVLGFPS